MGEIDTKILKQAVDKWGINAQIEMIIEECSELILSLQKLKRNHGKDLATDEKLIANVCDEVADVCIMSEQGKEMFDRSLVESRIKFKMNRLEEKLKR